MGESLPKIKRLAGRCLNRLSLLLCFVDKACKTPFFDLFEQSTKHVAFLHVSSREQKKFPSPLKLETEWKGADACGTARAGETNVPRFLARWLNTHPTASSSLQRSRKAEDFPPSSFHSILPTPSKNRHPFIANGRLEDIKNPRLPEQPGIDVLVNRATL